MADRSLYSHLSDPLPNGLQFLEQYSDRLGHLFSAAIWPLGSVGGTGDAVTASCDPPILVGVGLVEHMRFAITWAATNTAHMTLSIDGTTPVAVLTSDGTAMVAGSAMAGGRALLEYVGGAFLIIGRTASENSSPPYYLAITSSMTWTRPDGYADDDQFLIEGWGGGAGGGTANGAGGGGGGGYARKVIRYADLPATVSVVIGAGGPALTPGGNTAFGSILAAYGGGTCTNHTGTTNSNGGGGGGALGIGGNATVAGTGGNGGAGGGGVGAPGARFPSLSYGGGGGGREGVQGGWAIYGGGGGAGWNGAGGYSLHGGSGGNSGVAGAAPGGGGGWYREGGRGEIRVRKL